MLRHFAIFTRKPGEAEHLVTFAATEQIPTRQITPRPPTPPNLELELWLKFTRRLCRNSVIHRVQTWQLRGSACEQFCLVQASFFGWHQPLKALQIFFWTACKHACVPRLVLLPHWESCLNAEALCCFAYFALFPQFYFCRPAVVGLY